VTVEPVDLRLALGAAAGWLAVCFGLSRATASVFAIGVGGAIGGAALLLVAARWLPAAALALLLFCVAFELLPLAGRLAHARASPLYALAREHASSEVTLVTRSDPVPLAATGVGGALRVLIDSSAEAVRNGYGSAARCSRTSTVPSCR
jgi:competence protein ComEC